MAVGEETQTLGSSASSEVGDPLWLVLPCSELGCSCEAESEAGEPRRKQLVSGRMETVQVVEGVEWSEDAAELAPLPVWPSTLF